MSNVDHDRETLAAIFTSRVSTCKKSEQEVASEAIAERLRCLQWLKSNKHWRGAYFLHEVKDGAFDEMALSIGYLKRRFG